MNRRTLLAASIAAMAALLGHVNPACAVDLLSVVEQASDHDADLAAMRAASRAAQQAVPKARAGLLPQVGGGWGRAYNSTAIDVPSWLLHSNLSCHRSHRLTIRHGAQPTK